jgi:hypothetical protein
MIAYGVYKGYEEDTFFLNCGEFDKLEDAIKVAKELAKNETSEFAEYNIIVVGWEES